MHLIVIWVKNTLYQELKRKKEKEKERKRERRKAEGKDEEMVGGSKEERK